MKRKLSIKYIVIAVFLILLIWQFFLIKDWWLLPHYELKHNEENNTFILSIEGEIYTYNPYISTNVYSDINDNWTKTGIITSDDFFGNYSSLINDCGIYKTEAGNDSFVVVKSPNGNEIWTFEKPNIDFGAVIDSNYNTLVKYDFLSPEAARLIAEACVSYSKKNTLYASGIVSAKETRFLQYGKTILYVEVVTKDDTHLFFRVPGHQTKYGNWIKEIWKDDVGDDGTILLIYVYD